MTGEQGNKPVIVLDANALISIGENNPLLWRLVDAAKNGEQQVAVPYVALDEVVRDKAHKLAKTCIKDRKKATDELPHLSELVEEAAWKWGRTFEIFGVEIIATKDAHIEEADRRKREGLPPFTGRDGKQAKNDYRDALIYCAVKDTQEEYGSVIFVCNDNELRNSVANELEVPVRKNSKKFLVNLFGVDGKVVVNPFDNPRSDDGPYVESLRMKYSHPGLEQIQPERSHNRFNIESKLDQITTDFKEQICYLLAVARLVQPAMVSDTISILKEEPFRYTEDSCNSALDCLIQDGAVRIIGKTMIVEDEDFAEQAIEKLGERVIDLMRMFNG